MVIRRAVGLNKDNNIESIYKPMEEQPKPQSDLPQMDQPDIINPAMSSVPSFQSINSMNANPPEEDYGEELQIVQTKSDKRINHEEILRMFNEQVEKEERERQEIELKRRESLKNKVKTQQKQPPKKTSQDEKKSGKENTSEAQRVLSQRSSRIKKRIEQHCRKYKSLYRPSIYDTKMQRFRFDCKEKLFFHLCYGLEELREMQREELSETEQQLFEKDCYDVCRRISFQVDLQMVKLLNKGDRQEITREYKQQFETLLNNIKDQANFELKRKIINGTFTPQRIAVANEIEFFTTAKREEILEKQKRYIAEFTVENVLQPFNQEDREEILERPKVVEEGPREEEAPILKPQKSGFANKYLEESSILHLEQLLSDNQLTKMLNRLEEDLQGQSRSRLIANFTAVFSQQ